MDPDGIRADARILRLKRDQHVPMPFYEVGRQARVKFPLREPDEKRNSDRVPASPQMAVPGRLHQRRVELDIQLNGTNRVRGNDRQRHSVEYVLELAA